jgi:hypothetical protein
MSIYLKRIEKLLIAAELHPKPAGSDIEMGIKQVTSEFPFDVYKSLGGEKDWRGIRPFYPDFVMGSKQLTLDEADHFNRYRLMTLRHELYNNFSGFDKASYQRYCRNHEKDCIKTAANEKDWTSSLAEAHFGRAVDPGDFYGNGSPGWKLKAFRHFLTDHLNWLERRNVVRISVYDPVLVDGQLTRLDKLLLTSSNRYDEILVNYLLRRIKGKAEA